MSMDNVSVLDLRCDCAIAGRDDVDAGLDSCQHGRQGVGDDG